MIIDFSTHLITKDMLKLVTAPLEGGIKYEQIDALWDADQRLKIMKKYKVDKQVITPSASFFKGSPGKTQLDLCRMANDEFGNLQEKYDGKFVGLASVPLADNPDEAVDEIKRARQDLGLRGVELYSNVNGQGLDDRRFFKFYAELVRLGIPIFLHPTDWGWQSYPLLNDYRLKNRIAWPFDTAQAMSRIVYGGVLDEFPDLKIVTHHLGSIVPIMMGRLNYETSGAQGTGAERVVSNSRALVKKFKMFYGDTAVNCWPLSLETGYKFFGAKHMVFGSDYPFGWNGGEGWLKDNLKILKDLRIPSSEKNLIFAGNAIKLLKL